MIEENSHVKYHPHIEYTWSLDEQTNMNTLEYVMMFRCLGTVNESPPQKTWRELGENSADKALRHPPFPSMCTLDFTKKICCQKMGYQKKSGKSSGFPWKFL